ncbi:MAG: threonine synthase [Proteiniphilum sp.]|jgi:threonine synthase|nr:threonine synthase [Proteiniphilum sp.]
MIYYSTNKKAPAVSLREAVVKGLAPDGGLYMPERIAQIPQKFFDGIRNLSFTEIAETVAEKFFGDDLEKEKLDAIVDDTLSFEIPLRQVEKDIYALELFHGPTFAFKDVGARFMARMLSHFVRERQEEVNVLTATSGDTGSAVANGFLGMEGIRVFVLYPSGKVSDMQEAQFTTLGQNIVALEVDGSFDDCQALVKSAFMDGELNERLNLTSANSINVARFLPQSFYYFLAYAQLMKRTPAAGKIVFSVPSGNLGNLTAGLFAKRMGLPVERFIAANNRNDVFHEYLRSGKYAPRASVQTVANAMDVGAPSNFDRILDLYRHSHEAISGDIASYRYGDDEIRAAIKNVHSRTGYLLDPHGACACLALKEGKRSGETGVFLATAHPAKFGQTVEACTGTSVQIPDALAAFMRRRRHSVRLPNDFCLLKKALIDRS